MHDLDLAQLRMRALEQASALLTQSATHNCNSPPDPEDIIAAAKKLVAFAVGR